MQGTLPWNSCGRSRSKRDGSAPAVRAGRYPARGRRKHRKKHLESEMPAEKYPPITSGSGTRRTRGVFVCAESVLSPCKRRSVPEGRTFPPCRKGGSTQVHHGRQSSSSMEPVGILIARSSEPFSPCVFAAPGRSLSAATVLQRPPRPFHGEQVERSKPFCIRNAFQISVSSHPCRRSRFFWRDKTRPSSCRLPLYLHSTDPPISGGIRHLLHWSVTFIVYFTSSAESCRPLVSIKFFYYVIMIREQEVVNVNPFYKKVAEMDFWNPFGDADRFDDGVCHAAGSGAGGRMIPSSLRMPDGTACAFTTAWHRRSLRTGTGSRPT